MAPKLITLNLIYDYPVKWSKYKRYYMGERHLIYVRIDDKMFGRFLDEEIYYNGRVIGLHHQ